VPSSTPARFSLVAGARLATLVPVIIFELGGQVAIQSFGLVVAQVGRLDFLHRSIRGHGRIGERRFCLLQLALKLRHHRNCLPLRYLRVAGAEYFGEDRPVVEEAAEAWRDRHTHAILA
jgi:hypothetical protein